MRMKNGLSKRCAEAKSINNCRSKWGERENLSDPEWYTSVFLTAIRKRQERTGYKTEAHHASLPHHLSTLRAFRVGHRMPHPLENHLSRSPTRRCSSGQKKNKPISKSAVFTNRTK